MSFGWQTIPAIVITLFVIVTIHELGHYLFAKWSGIRVDEFAIGFGPKVYGIRRGETLYSIRLIPAGGYVRMAGMMGVEGEADAGERNFYRATIPRKGATILAGGVFNLILAGILFAVVAVPAIPALIGIDSPLAAAGISANEPLLDAGGIPIPTDNQQRAADAIHRATASSGGRALPVVYRNGDGQQRTAQIAPLLVLDNESVPPTAAARKAAPPEGLLVVESIDGRPQQRNGVPVLTGDPASLLGGGATVRISGHVLGAPSQRFTNATVSGVQDASQGSLGTVAASWKLGFNVGEQGKSLPAAVWSGFREVPTQVSNIFTGVYELVTTPNSGGITGPNGVSGPIGIVRYTNVAARGGWVDLVQWMGLLSVNLGVVNLLPIPFLDGGRFVFIVIEALRRRRVRPQLEMAFHYAGLMLILTFVIFVSIHDIQGPG